MNTLRLRYMLLVILVSVLTIVSANGCQSEYNAIELVPERANLVATLEINKIVNDEDIRDTYDNMKKEPGQPQTINELLGEIFEGSGMDISEFYRVMMFIDASDMERKDYVGFIVEGNFDENQFIDYIEENTGEKLSISEYKSHNLYVNEKDDATFAILSDKTLLVGSPQAVKDSIDVVEGDGKPADNQLIDTYKQYDNSLVALAYKVSVDPQDALPQDIIDDMPFSMSAFYGMDMIGFSLDKEKKLINAKIEFHLQDNDSAQDVYDTINGMISMFKGLIDEPEVKEVLGNIEISISKSWVTIDLEIGLSQIEDMIKSFQ